jgi:uncharacterized repeat protein (TIGR03803 family)
MKTKLQAWFILLALLVGFAQTSRAAVSFTNTPAAVSNTYTGTLTLQIGGLTNTETVLIQKYLDLNTNGIIDGSDLLVQQFSLTDGQTGMVIGGVTNFNVPGDLNPAPSNITAMVNFKNSDFLQNVVGKYLLKLSSPVNHFSPITNSFTVTNFAYAQKFTGNVVSNSTSVTVSNALVVLLPPNPNQGSPLVGVVANNVGNYTLPAPPGTYSLLVYRNNYVGNNFPGVPVLTLGAGQTVTTNLTLAPAASSISGKLVDANNSSIGLPSARGFVQSTNGPLFTLLVADSGGNFTVPVTVGAWRLQNDDTSLIVLGYLGLQGGTSVASGTTGLSFACPKATALIYGSVKNNLGNPTVALDVYASDNNGLYQSDAYTDANGNYVLGVVGFGTSDSWQVQANDNNQLNNYVFSQQTVSGQINAGQAVLQNFTAILATNQITGNVKFNGTNIIGVGVNAFATIGGVGYQASTAHTDGSGNYSINVANGAWSINLNCNGGDNDSLDNILGNGNYQCPNSQNITIANNNGTANFIVLPSDGGSGQIFGYVKDTGGNPVSNATVYVANNLAGNPNFTNTTDGAGYYSFSVTNGEWDVSVDCGVLNSLGYQCVSDQFTNVSNDAVEVDFAAQTQLPLTVLHGFTALDPTYGTNTDGANPAAGLILSGNILYGTTLDGGTYGNGTVFACNTSALGFPTLHSFSAGSINPASGLFTNSDGINPQAGLILSGNILYGTAAFGGTNGNGTVFTLNTNGTGYSVLHTFTTGSTNPVSGLFTNSDGANSVAGLILSGNNLYGTAAYGGTNGNGTVFAVNTNGTGYSVLHTFTTGKTNFSGVYTNSDGANPNAGLILSGNILYGTASMGGTNGNGTLFAVNINGSGFTLLHSFTALDPTYATNSDGANPVGGLILSGNVLYGTAQHGGTDVMAPDNGTVFAVNTNGSGFTTLHSFSNDDGTQPFAGLVLSGQTLYGTTLGGGSSGYGTVFAVNTNGTSFASVYGFTGGNDGGNPFDGLIVSGNILYGTAVQGGINNNGTVFSLSLVPVSAPPQLTIARSGGSVIISWPYPSTGWTLQTNNSLSTGTWGNYLGTVVNNTVTNAPPAGNVFFRLKQ